jgi:hypothetical protein
MKKSTFTLLLIINIVLLKAQPILPVPDHIIVIMLENKGYSNIIGSSNAPYLNSLANDPKCALFSNSYGVTHPSQPNYISLFSGNNQGVINDNAPTGIPYSTCNLGSSLLANGYSFRGYSEDLPAVGSTINSSGNYVQRHSPWTFWQGTGVNQLPAATNQPYTTYQSITNFSVLPTVSFIIPNLVHDMHNPVYSANTAIINGDAWLSTNIPALVSWVKTHNSLLIIQYDEDEGYVVGGAIVGGNNNNIPTMFIGPMVQGGTYTNHINHFSILRTIEDMYALPLCDSSNYYQPITNCWNIASATGIQNSIKQSQSLKLYPVPANNQIAIDFTSESEDNAVLSITDITGRILFTEEKQINPTLNIITLDVKAYNPSVYFISLKGSTIQSNQRFIIEK